MGRSLATGWVITVALSSVLSSPWPLRAAESPYLYGIHDADPNPQEFLDHVKNGGATGWVTATVAIGSRPDDFGGGNFSALANQGHSVIVRLSYGYCPDGSIPSPDKYADFAKRAANYAAATQGADLFVIGNETNLSWEWPVINGRQVYVSPQSYAQVYRMAYNEIKAKRPGAKVLVQALAPFAGPFGAGASCNPSIPADPQPLNWVQYMKEMLTAIKQSGAVDGIALHINSRGYTYNDIHSTQKINAGGQDLYFSFYVYKDWVDLGIPSDLYYLPLYATEANGLYFWKGGHPENPAAHYEPGWVQEIYAEINRYNQQAVTSGKPIFRAVNLYRWCNWCDGWNIDSSNQFPNPYKGQILSDLDQAVTAKYAWPGGTTPPIPSGSNLARGTVAWQASSVYSSAYGGDKAYDGVASAASKWTSSGSSAESWLALDLESASAITGFIVRHAGAAGELKGYNTQAFRLESGSSLSGPWTVLATVSNAAQDNTSTVVLASAVTTRYVRLYVTDAGIDNYARIPEFEVYGTASTPPPGPGSLVNGDFESSTPGSAVGTGWNSFSSAGYSASFNVVSDQVHGGALAQRVTSPQPTANDRYAGVYQVVATTPGQSYAVRAWNRTQFSGGNVWDYIARLGIDLTGGTSFEAASVSWQEFDSAKNAWLLLERSATATGGSMTIFLQAWRKWPTGGASYAWFDDVQVVPGGNRPPTAVISANPTSGPAPLTVAFSGSGSTDPDGDPLTYSWSFGDGAQGSGVTVSHTYSAAGSYTATLTASDGKGGTNSASVTINVRTSPGSLVNGDFESSTPGSAVGTGWTAFTSAGYGATFAVASDQVHGGALAQRVTSPQPSSNDKYAGVYQVVATQAGQTYTVRAWNRTHFTGGNAWDHIARLGIDLKGGTDFQALSVTWYEFDSAKDAWHLLEQSVTATGASMTIYLQSWRKWASGGDSLTWFDDVQMVSGNRPPTAVVSANPTSGPAHLTVAFSGSGSTDPDGDPLTYSWSFGDGTQGSGVTVSHIYSAAGSYTATLTVSDGKGGTNSASVIVTVSPASGNRPPQAVISANPRSSTLPFTVTLDGSGSTDPDGDPLTYSWNFADGVQGSGPTMQRTFEDANGDGKEAGGYLVTLTVSDGKGGTGSASVRIGVFPPGCPTSLDFDAIRAQLDAQGKDLEFVKIGFHTGGGGTFGGLGRWERCLDAAGVPFTVKQVPSARDSSAGEAAQLRARSGVPHTIIFRRCCEEKGVVYELPACARTPVLGWNACTDENAQQEAQDHWTRHLQAFPPGVQANKQSIWVETINEPWKGDNTRNNAEWLAKFSYYTALLAMADGYNYAAFGWSSGEPEYGPPPNDNSPGFQWDGPEMQNFLRLAAQYPDRIAIALHEYNYWDPSLRDTYPSLVGRFERLFERCDANGIGRPTVLITEFGWPSPPPVDEVMSANNVPWAAGLYAQHPRVTGVALWDAGDMSSIISGMTEYALQNYFAIPKEGAPSCPQAPLTTPEDRWKLEIWNNRQMTGQPVEQCFDAPGGGFRFAWGQGGGSQCAGSDNFAVRLTRRAYFDAAATYTFRATADDGVRLWVDGELIIDKWVDQPPTTYEASKLLTAGWHDLRLDYYENAGGASAELSWAASSTSCLASVSPANWRGEYFNNRTLGGTPVMVRDDGSASLGFDWGLGSPALNCGVPSDGFSARWTRTATFDAGTLRFTVTVDDGVRLYVDGVLRLEKWFDQAPATYGVDVPLTAGEHTIRMDYYENGGGAVAKLSWAATASKVLLPADLPEP